ncbi:MAG TPA: glycosyltransferase family 39 protein, partial [Candidatus Dormibacteraeota bacterium]|nr:glycosyltransferase family 39 protein [Candidatus Dormibacteraeota bacterium]
MIHAALLAWCAATDAPTNDEPVHLAGGLRRVQNREFDVDRGNPPLTSTLAAAPVLWVQPKTDWRRIKDSFAVGRDFIKVNGPDSFWLVTLGRWACIPLSLLGLVLCYCWAAELYGTRAGLFAAGLWCFCPNLLAHGHLLTGDMAATTFLMSATYSFWRWLSQPSWTRAVVLGVAAALALLSKYTCVLLIPLCGVTWIVWLVRASCRGAGELSRHLLFSSQLLLSAFICVDVMHLAYPGRDTFAPLQQYAIGRRIAGINTTEGSSSKPQSSWQHTVAMLPVPLPVDYIAGAEEIRNYYRATVKPSYLRGERKQGRWWYYYIYGLLVKIPLGTWLLLGMSGVVWCRRTDRSRADELFLLLCAASVMTFVTVTTTTQNHVRYVLPAVPFLYIFAAGLLDQRPRARLLPVLKWAIASSY